MDYLILIVLTIIVLRWWYKGKIKVVEKRAFDEGYKAGYQKAAVQYDWQECAIEEVKNTLDGIVR